MLLASSCGKTGKMDVETGETQTEIAREEVLHLSISTAAFWEGTAVGEALEKTVKSWRNGRRERSISASMTAASWGAILN